jgi:hypothetical protein
MLVKLPKIRLQNYEILQGKRKAKRNEKRKAKVK